MNVAIFGHDGISINVFIIISVLGFVVHLTYVAIFALCLTQHNTTHSHTSDLLENENEKYNAGREDFTYTHTCVEGALLNQRKMHVSASRRHVPFALGFLTYYLTSCSKPFIPTGVVIRFCNFRSAKQGVNSKY